MLKKYASIRKVIAILLFPAVILSVILIILTVRHIPDHEDQQFETYTRQLFCQEVSGNTISLHYTLKNPGTYDIKNAPVTFGTCTTDVESICTSAENTLAYLQSFDRERLSEENQLTYDILESYLTSALAEAPYALYEEPLAPLTGTQAQLPVLLSEYQFYDASDVDTYLELLTKLPDYFHEIAEFEQAKSDTGLFMTADAADALIEECQAFIDMEDENYLYSSFEERLTELMSAANSDDQAAGLTSGQKQIYIETNKNRIRDYVFPAYEELIRCLSNLRNTGKNENGLCYLPEGKQYYELLAASETGSSRTIPEMQELTQQQILDDLTAIQEALDHISEELSVTSDVFNPQGSVLETSDPAAILDTLKSSLVQNFPEPVDVTTQIKYVQESMEEYLSPAFYMVPAIDDTASNVIYINQGHLPDDLSLFTTLAHEGYPGHLYQTTYYAAKETDPIRSLLNFGGYTEGWATYSEMMSYYYAPISKDQATLMQKNASIILGLYALADMGIHYDGWTLTDTISFFRSYGITDTGTIRDIFELIIADPANYLKYYIGYVEFLELKKDAIENWGEGFSQKRFHTAVLDVGPAPFAIVGDVVK